MAAELTERYGTAASEPGRHPLADDVVVFVTARDDDGHPLGCGALRLAGPAAGELKRMYVAPPARRRGVARAVLVELERHAIDRGWTTLRLQTGVRQPEAIAMYESTGYVEVDPYPPYDEAPLVRCFEKRLS